MWSAFKRGYLSWWKNIVAWDRKINGTCLFISHKYIFKKKLKNNSNLTNYEECCTCMMIHKDIYLQNTSISNCYWNILWFSEKIFLECNEYFILDFYWSNYKLTHPSRHCLSNIKWIKVNAINGSFKTLQINFQKRVLWNVSFKIDCLYYLEIT